MRFNVKELSDEYDFWINGASYVGNPKNNTMMYITKKVADLTEKFSTAEECLIFAESGMDVKPEYKKRNCFIFSKNPQYEYAKCADKFAAEKRIQENAWGYDITDGGYYVGRNVVIGKNPIIEPGVVIGHGVEIGDNAIILAGAVIKNSEIGDNFFCNEKAVVGSSSFTQAVDNEGNRTRIPTLGRVVIGNCVEVGMGDNVAAGSIQDTVIDDFAKLDALVHIGHDAHICRNAEITAGSVIGGFAEIGEASFVGINSVIKNRIAVGKRAVVGMGATVIRSVDDGCVVVGNPAKDLKSSHG